MIFIAMFVNFFIIHCFIFYRHSNALSVYGKKLTHGYFKNQNLKFYLLFKLNCSLILSLFFSFCPRSLITSI